MRADNSFKDFFFFCKEDQGKRVVAGRGCRTKRRLVGLFFTWKEKQHIYMLMEMLQSRGKMADTEESRSGRERAGEHEP